MIFVVIIDTCIFTKFRRYSSTLQFDLSFPKSSDSYQMGHVLWVIVYGSENGLFSLFLKNQKNLKRGLRINVHVYFHKIPILVEIRNLFDFEHPDFERYIWFLSF